MLCIITEYCYPLFVIWLALRAYQKYSAILRAKLLCDTTHQNVCEIYLLALKYKRFFACVKNWSVEKSEPGRGLALIVPSTRPLADFSPMTTCSWATQRWFISFAKTRARIQRIQYPSNESYTYTIDIFKRNLMLTKTIQDFLQGEGIQLFFITKCEWGLFFLSLITHFHRDLYSKSLWATEAKSEYLF